MESLDSNKIYSGNYSWILDAFKIVNKEIKFDTALNKENIKEEIKFYECIIFNSDKEDSVYVQIEDNLFEYFSSDKCELMLKLMKIFENRNSKDRKLDMGPSLNKKFLPDIKSIKSFKNDLSKKQSLITSNSNTREASTELKKTSRRKIISSSVLGLTSLIKGNLFLIYKDNSTRWVFDYEVKKLLFYLRFLPDHKNIKVIRIFPLHFKKMDLKYQSYVDKEDEFTEIKDDNHKKNGSQERSELLFNNLVEKVKNKFYEKYNLLLRTFDVETFELNGIVYLHDVKDMKFEKYETKHIKLITERKLINFREKFQYKNMKINKDAPNHREIKKFFFTMLDVYENTKKHHKLDQYLDIAQRDSLSDNVFRDIKPDCPYTFSELMGKDVSKNEFIKWASTNRWNQ
jgi:hypothetical protein